MAQPKKKTVHAHGCPNCKGRFECNCEDRKDNPRCMPCRTGRPGWQLLIENRLPKDCCRVDSRLASKDDIVRYDLGSTCPWYICRACARTHPFRDPTKEKVSS